MAFFGRCQSLRNRMKRDTKPSCSLFLLRRPYFLREDEFPPDVCSANPNTPLLSFRNVKAETPPTANPAFHEQLSRRVYDPRLHNFPGDKRAWQQSFYGFLGAIDIPLRNTDHTSKDGFISIRLIIL